MVLLAQRGLVTPELSCSGSTGYGHFRVDDWTTVRMTVLHPVKEPPYVLLGSLSATQEANGTTTGMNGAKNGVNGSSPQNGVSHGHNGSSLGS